jgi:uncharacterized membrane protein YbhN (UPF0104 family)
MLIFALAYSLCWWMLMDALQPGGARLWSTSRLFLLSWPGRYVPASIPYYAGRIVSGPRIGLSRGAVGASLVYENLFALAVNGAIAVTLLGLGYHRTIGGNGWIAASLIAASMSLLALHPAVMRGCLRFGSSRIPRLQPVAARVLPMRATVRVALVYGVASCISGLAFWCSLQAVSDGAGAPLPLAIAAYNMAGIAGMLAIGVPGGIGVREGVAVAIIGATVSVPVALGAAALTRLAGVVADVAPVCAIAAWEGGRRMRVSITAAATAKARAQ